MKSRLLGITLLTAVILTLATHAAFAEKMLYDDFSKPYIDVQKWGPREFVREVDRETGKLISKVGYNASDNNRNTTVFQDPASINSIAALISVNEAVSDTLYAADGFARLEGYFYNAKASGSQIGDIWAGLYIGDRGLGLEAWWKAKEVMDDYLSEWKDVGSGALIPPGVLSYGNEFDVEIAYDGENGISFSVAGVKDTFNGPPRLGAIGHPVQVDDDRRGLFSGSGGDPVRRHYGRRGPERLGPSGPRRGGSQRGRRMR